MTGDPCRQVSSTNQMFDHAHMGGDEMPAPLDPLDRISNLERVFANGSPIPFVILAAAEMDALVEVARAARFALPCVDRNATLPRRALEEALARLDKEQP